MSTDSTKKEWQAAPTLEALLARRAGSDTAFGKMNSAEAGARSQRDVDVGEAPYQLYSLATPNGQKIGIMLEELGAKYDAHTINIMKEDQFTSGFVAINPNSKIPALVDQSDENNKVNLFESGGILMYLADKHKKFIPPLEKMKERAEVVNWVMWQMGSGPYFGQFGHFYTYAPKTEVDARDYGVARYGMEVQRCLSVLDKELEKKEYMAEWGYSIADMAIYPWVLGLEKGYKAQEFLGVAKYKNIARWIKAIESRPAVEKGMKITPFGK